MPALPVGSTTNFMTRNGKIILAGVIAVALLATAGVKWIFFPSVKDAYFTLNDRALKQVPAGFAVVRPTHFSQSSRTGIMSTMVPVHGKPVWRMTGRNVTLKQIIALAYGRSEGRVLLPASAPTNHFDFLVTVSGDQEQRLQKAIRKKLGYVAHVETHDEDVLALKIKNGALPGLAISDGGAKENVHPDKGRLYLTHLRPGMLVNGFEQILKMPVVDKTDLTNFYDFSTAWGPQIQKQIGSEATARAALDKILAEWGLGLDPTTESVEVLVVKNGS